MHSLDFHLPFAGIGGQSSRRLGQSIESDVETLKHLTDRWRQLIAAA